MCRQRLMPTSLNAFRQKLLQRLQTLDSAFEREALAQHVKRVDRWALQEGLISALWQSWCRFCREVLINSAIGTNTASGQAVTSPYRGRSEPEIAYIAKCLANTKPVKQIKVIAGAHQEPTWGDLSKVNLITTGLGTSNSGQLLSAFAGGVAINDLQLCRNASAHLGPQLLTQIVAAKVRYMETSLTHPSDVMLWVDPTTKDYLWKSWLDEMDLISSYAIA